MEVWGEQSCQLMIAICGPRVSSFNCQSVQESFNAGDAYKNRNDDTFVSLTPSFANAQHALQYLLHRLQDLRFGVD